MTSNGLDKDKSVTRPARDGNPLGPFLRRQGTLVLDAGLATALESSGHDLSGDLWSARILLEDPAAVRRVHREFLEAGADCITTATYQASIAGFRRHGLSDTQAIELIELSVRLAIDARNHFWLAKRNRRGRLPPLVAASVGPYGAYLADGSEYTGDYGIDDAQLREFHADRWRILAGTEADLLACETLPSAREAAVLLALLAETPGRWAWMSFSCRDGTRLHDGSRLAEVARACDREPRVAAVGVNCTPPQYIAEAITVLRAATSKPVIVYPNSGETYRGSDKTWLRRSEPFDLAETGVEWARLGAGGIGGCCRVSGGDITRLRRRLMAD